MNWYKAAQTPNIVYHGTGNAAGLRQTGFNYQFAGKGNEQYGPGFYFTNKKSVAEGYTKSVVPGEENKIGGDASPEVLEAQVQLKNPIRVNGAEQANAAQCYPVLNQRMARQMLTEALKYRPEVLEDWGDLQHEGMRNVFNTCAKSYVGQSSAMALYDWFGEQYIEKGLRLLSKLTGYDGIIIDFGNGIVNTVAWFPEQIKILPPKNPTNAQGPEKIME